EGSYPPWGDLGGFSGVGDDHLLTLLGYIDVAKSLMGHTRLPGGRAGSALRFGNTFGRAVELVPDWIERAGPCVLVSAEQHPALDSRTFLCQLHEPIAAFFGGRHPQNRERNVAQFLFPSFQYLLVSLSGSVPLNPDANAVVDLRVQLPFRV